MTEPKANFFREVQQELKKVSWTTRDELFFCTKVVVVATLVFAMGIYCSDVMIRGTLHALNVIVKMVFG